MTDVAPEFQPTLKWRRTLPDQTRDDFVALSDGFEVCRFYRYRVSSELQGQWFWTVFAFHRTPNAETGAMQGFVRGSARDAAKVAEAAFERAKAVWGIPDVVRFATAE
ncbi:hypothetical protein E3C22_16615 [Jiella endophytica]|uniref:Uncharacterized protein n=1 Tax=Jiella endophytica TaxID=2558362 RepID=A0A4Y8RE89_9HYPH|nr:hypothetical protein [Jiella endophytica]TFF20531.1 hypothetical protein E3C22_16615 [Jiella endophytica]